MLGHPTRVRILELLHDGELSVGALRADLDLDPGGTPQHHAALNRICLIDARRQGTSVFYRVADERVFDLLAGGRAIASRRLAQQQSILSEVEAS